MNKNYRWIVLIVALALFFRFWHLSSLLVFTLDEELEAFIVRNIITGTHLPAIGVSVAPLGLYLSPLFYLLAAIPFWLGSLSPISWGISASLLGSISVLVLYLSFEKMYGQWTARVSSLIYTCSFLAVMYDKHFWNVTPMILVSAVSMYSLYRLTKKDYLWYLILAIFLSVGLSSHLSALVLLLLSVLVIVVEKIKTNHKYFFCGLAILVISQSPLLVFELRHNFQQSKTLLKFFFGQHSGLVFSRVGDSLFLIPKLMSRFIYTLGSHDFAREHTYGLVEIIQRDQRIPIWMLLISFGLIVTLVVVAIKRWQSIEYRLQLYLILATVISLSIYGVLFTGNLFEFYLLILIPTFSLALAQSLKVVWSKSRILSVSLLTLILSANIFATLTSSNNYGLETKLKVINWSKDYIQDQPYELHSIGIDHKFEGYRFLFERYFKAPVKSYADKQLGWLYPGSLTGQTPKLEVVIASHEPEYQDRINAEEQAYRSNLIKEAYFGEIHVMVIKE